MLGTPTPPPSPFPSEPDAAELAAWRAELAAAQASPWHASLFMRRLGSAGPRLAELRDWLAALPRRMRRGWARRLALGLPATALFLALATGGAQAASITVDPSGSGCTLEDAIVAANTDTATGSCAAGSGPDVIGFNNANGSYAIFSNYGGPLPAITTEITIQGNGNTTLDGEAQVRVLDVTTGGDLTLNDATITGGNEIVGGGIHVDDAELTGTNVTIQGNVASFYGGGLHANDSTVNLTSCTISGNSAGDDGGGMYVSDSLVTLTDCTISGNLALDDGGGATISGEATVILQSSMVSGNISNDVGGGLDVDGSALYIYESSIVGNTAADRGGGIDADSALVVVFESTISGNTAADGGGGIDVFYGYLYMTNATLSGNSTALNGGGLCSEYGFAAIQFATITGNSAGGVGGGIYANYAPYIRNSIVAGQAAGADCAGTQPDSDAYNIESATSCGFTATGDQQNVSGAALNLGPLNLNAPGTTQTHALGAGSAALDQIPDNTNGCGTDVTADQRGVARPQNGACDVGAYEAIGQAVPTPTAIAPTAATVTHFAAAPDPTGRVHIAWETSSEADLAGFRVERAALGPAGDPTHPAGSWTAVGGLIPARGGAAAGGRYAVADGVAPGAYAYRLVVVNQTAPPEYHGSVVTRVEALRAFLPWVMRR